jgi:hypothetical protein
VVGRGGGDIGLGVPEGGLLGRRWLQRVSEQAPPEDRHVAVKTGNAGRRSYRQVDAAVIDLYKPSAFHATCDETWGGRRNAYRSVCIRWAL